MAHFPTKYNTVSRGFVSVDDCKSSVYLAVFEGMTKTAAAATSFLTPAVARDIAAARHRRRAGRRC